MKVVVAVDSFKGSMTSLEAGAAVRRGVLRAVPDAQVVVRPLADGGEGTTEALVEGLGGSFMTVQVTGPLGEPVTARYGILPDVRTAVLEMAEAAGIALVDREELDPWRATTVGVGEMLLHALDAGCREFLIGIGGSATTECGIGMLTALGYSFLDGAGKPLPPVFASLAKVAEVREDRVPAALKECRFRIVCDVNNPLCGETGAVCVFGPQKGVKPSEREEMDAAVAHFAQVTAAHFGRDHAPTPGAGASGGLGFAFLSYLPNVRLEPGISIVLEAIGLEEELADTDVVVTGEGRLDAQTAMGKVPAGVAALAKEHRCKVVALAGSVTEDAEACHGAGIDAFFPILRGVSTLEEAMDRENACRNMERTAEEVFRLVNALMT